MDGRGIWFTLIILIQVVVAVKPETFEVRRNGQGCFKGDTRMRTNTTDRLQRFRRQMHFFGYDAFIVTSDDEHQSEYVSDYDKRREYMTGFTGSAGTAVILRDSEAALWTDSRYYTQADQEMDCNWLLMPEERKDNPSITDWLRRKLTKGARVGADARLVDQEQWENWSGELSKAEINLLANATNLVDMIWLTGERPNEPSRTIFIHEVRFAGKSWQDKIRDIRIKLSQKGLKGLLVSSLTEVAWLFNLRGSDVPYVPVFKAFAVVTHNDVKLYIKRQKIGNETSLHLNEKKCPPSDRHCIKVDIKDYKDIYKEASKDLKGLKVIMSRSISYALYNSHKKELVTLGMTPTQEEMVIKNPVEIDGMEKAMLKDSVAVIAFLAMLEAEVKAGKHWDEIKAARTVHKYRSHQEHYRGESFETISAVGDHAAMPHYTPKVNSNRTIDKQNVYLLDSGGQYLDGTTDITRTLHFGTPTDFQREAYTRVLMGVISLATLIFPEGTKDRDVDILCHQALYNIGLDYGHGTGHGVGSYLSVHEFPPRLRLSNHKTEDFPLVPGMFFSIEPGFYQENEFGIRLETIFTVVETKTKYKYENKSFYTFEPVVWIPFEKKMIKMELLSMEQVKWLDHYNAKCVALSGQRLRLARYSQGLDWLMARAKPLKHWTNHAASVNTSLLSLVLALVCTSFGVQ